MKLFLSILLTISSLSICIASEYEIVKAINNNDYKSFVQYISAISDVNIIPQTNLSFLSQASLCHPLTDKRNVVVSTRLKMIKHLLYKKANVNLQDKKGATALMYASGRPDMMTLMPGCSEIVKVLLKAKSNVNIQDNKGMTALMWSVLDESNIKIVQILLSNKAKSTIKRFDGKTAYDLAKEAGNLKALVLLSKYKK